MLTPLVYYCCLKMHKQKIIRKRINKIRKFLILVSDSVDINPHVNKSSLGPQRPQRDQNLPVPLRLVVSHDIKENLDEEPNN